jgi:hypothetical protein
VEILKKRMEEPAIDEFLMSDDRKGKRKMDFSIQNDGLPMVQCQTCSSSLMPGEDYQCRECLDNEEFKFLHQENSKELDYALTESDSIANSNISMMDVELSSNLMWYYADDAESITLNTKGPFNWMKMENLLETKTLTPSSMVRRADEHNFISLEQLLKDQEPHKPYLFFENETGRGQIQQIHESPQLGSSTLMDGPTEEPLQPNPADQQEPAVQNNAAAGQQQAFLNINIGPDLRVGIEAHGEWNSVMELVGLAGPIKNLFNSLLLYYGIIIFGLTIGIALPRTLGHITLVIMQKLVFPLAFSFFSQVSHLMQIVSDPVIDPIADFLLFIWKIIISFVVGGVKNVETYLGQSQSSYEIALMEAAKSVGRVIGVFVRPNDSIIESVILSKETVQNATITEESMYNTETTTLVFLGTIFIGYLEMLLYKLQREVVSNLMLVGDQWFKSSISKNNH